MLASAPVDKALLPDGTTLDRDHAARGGPDQPPPP